MDLPHVPLPPVQEILKPSLHRTRHLQNVPPKRTERNHLCEQLPHKSSNLVVEEYQLVGEPLEKADSDQSELHHFPLTRESDNRHGSKFPCYSLGLEDKRHSRLNAVETDHDEDDEESHEIDNMPSKHSESKSPSALEERVSSLEVQLKCRCNEFSKEIKLVQAELNVITDWIHSKFDTLLINRSSLFYRSLHKDMQKVGEISKSLMMMSTLSEASKVSWSSGTGNPASAKELSDRSRIAKKSYRSSRQKPIFKGVLGTWINRDDCFVQNTSNKQQGSNEESGTVGENGHVEIKEEHVESLVHDPFEDGYIPEVDDEGNVNVDFTPDTDVNKESVEEPTRPKRLSTRNVSYNGYLVSDEEEPCKPEKTLSRKKREKRAFEDFQKKLDQMQTSEDSGANSSVNPKKKYKPSEASTVRAKILANTPMMCDECGKVVKGPWTLKAHKEMHANIRRYTCHVCGYAFRRKPHLNAHLLLHEGVKHLKCQYCGRGFYLRRDLARHERTHTGEKPYNCTFPNCTKSFNVKQHLTMHYRTHTGERPYKCTVCEKSFSQANTLRIHKKLHEGGTSSGASGRRKPRISKANRTKNNDQVPHQLSSSTTAGGPSTSSTTNTNSFNSRKIHVPTLHHHHHHQLSSRQSSTDEQAVHLIRLTPTSSPSPTLNSTSLTSTHAPPGSPDGTTNRSRQSFRSPPPHHPQENVSHVDLLHQSNAAESQNVAFSTESRQSIHNVVISSTPTANSLSSAISPLPHPTPFDILQQSWRQGIINTGQPTTGASIISSSPPTLIGGNHQTTTTGIFLPQIYEPLNIHFTSYPPPPPSSS